jgi:CDP-glucose 4,6-dehydratase
MANNFWNNRRVFVTGCTGLVGSQTVQLLLERGAHVVGLVRDHVPGSKLWREGLANRIDIVHGAVEDLPLVERAMNEYEIKTVIHLAAQTIVGTANRNPLSTFETNIKGTWCVMEAARQCGTRPHVVVASSDKAYGDQPVLPYTEDSPLAAQYPYDASKACADILALSYHQTFGVNVCVTRCGNFYGGGDLNMSRLVPGTIRAVLSGERPVIRSDGSFLRDYFYVKDGAAAYLHLAEILAKRPEISGQAFNFSTETPLSVLQLVERILHLMETNLTPDVRNEARNEIKHQYLSAAKARELLHWRPLYDLDEALSETITWYRDYFATGCENSSEDRRRQVRPVAA